MKAAGRTETTVLIVAMRELSRTILSDDGVANAAIGEAADRLEQQATDILELRLALAGMLTTLDMLSTAGEKKYAFVESRRGSMVCVAPDMDHARSLLDRTNDGNDMDHMISEERVLHGGALDALEDLARQHCTLDKDGVANSGGISANAHALLTLADHGRFRIERAFGRMVVGRWTAAEG